MADQFDPTKLPKQLQDYLQAAMDNEHARMKKMEAELDAQIHHARHLQNRLDSAARLQRAQMQQSASHVTAPDPNLMFAQRLHNLEVRLAGILDKLGPLLFLLEKQRIETPQPEPVDDDAPPF